MFNKLKEFLNKKVYFENSKDGAKKLLKYITIEIDKEKEKYILDDSIWSIFIAWAPWSWKTEFVETVLDFKKYIVIDIDKYRKYFKWYNWKNAWDYQDSCSRVATWIFKYCIKNNLKFIFDGTLTSDIGKRNIKEIIKKWRIPHIILIYQDPSFSFIYTKFRQITNERNVDIETFIKIYFNSIKYSFEVKNEFKCNLIIASKNKNRKFKASSILSKKEFDKNYKIDYNKDTLLEKLSLLDKLFNYE